ncbi:MAG: nucleotide exchange factor GrpE [Clostridia bacterium]|nr:nucleotide exchange factor GrpE [Clostridia bacterium]
MSKKSNIVSEDIEDIENTENLDETLNNIDEENADIEVSTEEYISKLESELKDQRKKTDEYFEHLKRNMAEFDNYKKRIAKEKDTMYNVIASDLVADILPSLDNFEKALDAETEDSSFKEGISMIYTQLCEVLKKIGVTEIEALNTTFDPNLHEAVMHIEDENFSEKQVVEVFRKGYIIGDKVIRHAMVKVAN